MFLSFLPWVLAVFALTCCARLGAQQDFDYDYAAFRFPDIDRRALFGGFGAEGQGFQSRWGALGEGTSAFDQNVNLTYERFRNLPKLQSIERVGLGQDVYWRSSQSDVSGEQSFRRFGLFMDLASDHRYYVRPDFFIGADGLGSLALQTERNRAPGMEEDALSFSASLSPGISVGWGRLEPIDDVFLAKFMMDDMLGNGILLRAFSQAQLFELGQRMAFARNQRIFDVRRLRAYELGQLDAWFKAQGMVDVGDVRYFTTLTDNWLYAFRNQRFVGQRFSVGLRAHLGAQDFVENGTRSTDTDALGLIGYVDYTRQRPLNQYWQVVTTLRPSFMLLDEHDNLSGLSEQVGIWQLLVSHGYGYYPNSRTHLGISGEASWRALRADEALDVGDGLSLSLSLSADYFLSYQLRMRASLLAGYYWQDLESWAYPAHASQILASVGFYYAFF